jgi:hypothetical protein
MAKERYEVVKFDNRTSKEVLVSETETLNKAEAKREAEKRNAANEDKEIEFRVRSVPVSRFKLGN